MARVTDHVLDELADMVADRLEQRLAEHPKPDTTPLKWTDRLAATLRDIRLRRLASEGADVVGDHSKP